MVKICIDPGHNSFGEDTGAEGNGLNEQDINLDIGLRLNDILVANGFEMIMTRTGNLVNGLSEGYKLHESLQRRCDIANAFQANLFVSIHSNSADISSPNGVEILVSGLGGEAEKLADKVLPYLVGLGQTDRHVKIQNVYVLKNTPMPAILTENGFLSNAKDAEKLANPAFRQKIAIAHAKGIMEYFGIKSGGESAVEIAILKFTPEDDWAAKDVDSKHGGVANFTRQGVSKVIPAGAMLSDRLIVIGGPTTGHKNEILLSGKDKYETATKVAEYLKN
jgi:N-acetylmuramoyl-L-alanine amidase